VKLRALEEENRSLRELASFLKESGYDRVGARVIARSTDPRTASILIDRGAKDGLELGQAVVADEGFFVGKIIALTDRVATVLLASDPESRVAAAKAGERKLIGLVQGEGNGVARLSLVPQTVELKRDDVIVTAGTEEKIPPNLVVALVNEPEGKETDPFKTASLEPVLQAGQLDLVVVLRPTALRPGEGL
jgi:rod shape-determining protein MreC